MNPSIQHIQKTALLTIAKVSLVIGLFGLILPLIPGTPFLILSAVCFNWAEAL